MKHVLIMGASGDIGASIAKLLAEDGWSLYLHANTQMNRVDRLVREFSEAYTDQEFFGYQLDMTEEDKIGFFVEGIFSLDGVVFANGYTDYNLLDQLSSQAMDDMWKVHVKTPVRLIQLLQEKLSKSSQGRIVFISSVYAEYGSAMEVFYSTTKGAQVSFVKAYSKEVASLGITVNAVLPGAIETKMNQQLTVSEREELTQNIPLGRMGDPLDISFWVKQLLQKESGYLTGQAITISGGWPI
ncbi:elongation factor P 5-aminopentanone reductase [Lacticigenium naphthae]|uniref:elongation factor P 5-aminopentanone reductase n=1 Tax=Lacticigenium naphthae TaxID=515351 RepID=UPI0004167B4F|nr:SDR family NAD(P)-dependent oxidoreductase [Lacticigenium naphthae]